MVFIDGLGLGTANPEANPLAVAEMNFFRSRLNGRTLTADTIQTGLVDRDFLCVPTDTTLGVSGLPQSATGQTTLFTGVNAAKVGGKHIHGLPTRALREVINQYSLFKILNESGYRTTFANTFTEEYFETVTRGKWRHSVTTTAALAGGCRLRMIPDLINGEAVYQDITNEILQERGYDIPLIEPEAAATHLVNIAVKNDFTLFEYFQTDRCGHKQNWELALTLLNRLDRFLGTIAAMFEKSGLDLLITSDHGNIEDLSIKTHTLNPVPFIAFGKNTRCFLEIKSLVDVYRCICRYFNIPSEF